MSARSKTLVRFGNRHVAELPGREGLLPRRQNLVRLHRSYARSVGFQIIVGQPEGLHFVQLRRWPILGFQAKQTDVIGWYTARDVDAGSVAAQPAGAATAGRLSQTIRKMLATEGKNI